MTDAPDSRINVVAADNLPFSSLLAGSNGDWGGFSLLLSPAGPLELLALSERLAPSVLLVSDRQLAHFDHAALAASLRFGRRIRAIVVLTDDATVSPEQFLRLGCMGVIPGDSSPELILKAVQVVSRGEIWASRKLLARLIHGLLDEKSPQRLTPREVEVLSLISEGLSLREIASRLFISRETVKWYKRNLNAKLGPGGTSSQPRPEWFFGQD
ncbi:MAG: LuxR C-terminal-related transcriptional regulator [Bryobacteraceae bacterium]